MLFMCHGKARPGQTAEDRQKVVRIFQGWAPPAELKIVAHYVDPCGSDYVVVETNSAETLLEATAIWAPYIDYTVTPVMLASSAVERIQSAEQARQKLL